MTAIPDWLRGRDLTAVTIIPQTVNNGTLTPATTIALVGFIDSVEVDTEARNEDISAVNDVYANNVIVEEDTTMTLVEILKRNDGAGTASNNLLPLAWAYQVIYATFTRGGKGFSGYFWRASYKEGVTQKGKNVASLTLRQAGLGYNTSGTATAPVTYS